MAQGVLPFKYKNERIEWAKGEVFLTSTPFSYFRPSMGSLVTDVIGR